MKLQSNAAAENILRADKLHVYKTSIKRNDVLKDKTGKIPVSRHKFTQNWQFSTFLILSKI